ncbi:MAG TPA: hypothetical protein VES93_12760 [Ornithinibacter sp.]|nr:hypothetical protein [Ornithinibacter sp.]
MSGDDTASGPLRQARRARESGQAWKARDLLLAHVEGSQDPEALIELGEVLFEMGDLPRAGAVWFVAGAKGPDVDASVAAWREQSHDDFALMWASLPASARSQPRPRRVEALRERALRSEPATVAEVASTDEAAVVADDEDEGGFDAAWLIAWVLAVAFVVFAVIGFVTALGWLFPG